MREGEREGERERETVTVRESPSFLSCLLSFLGIVTDNGGEGRALVPFQKTVLKRERERRWRWMRIMSWRRRRRGDRLRRTSRAGALRRRYCKSLERERKRRGSHSPFDNAVDPFGIRNGRVYLRAEDRMRSDDNASAVHFLTKRLHESCKSLTQPL